MKKNMRTLFCILLVIAAIVACAVPSMAALSSTTRTVEDGGIYVDASGIPFNYTCRTSASTTSASGSLTYGKAALLSTTLIVQINYRGGTFPKTVSNACSGATVNVSTDNRINVDGSNSPGVINRVDAEHKIGTRVVVSQTVS